MGLPGRELTFCFVAAFCGLAAVPLPAVEAGSAPVSDSFFEQKIRPVLAESCYSCHSARATKLKGGLSLDTRAGALKGGKSGVVIVPGNPADSALLKAIRRADPDAAMPPDDTDKLPAETIANFEKWIKAGAAYPETTVAKPAALKPWWETIEGSRLRPAEDSIAATVDFYVNAKLQESGVAPGALAGDGNFVRRVTLDLIGRIPVPSEVREYEASTDSAKKIHLVDRLLASPAFIRHQARELDWMLMNGKSDPFREYLARSLKEGRGWDAVLRDVLTADGKNPALKGCEQFVKTRAQDLDRLTSDVSVRFFGVNISCAQCHDHPHVPAWTQDHYFGMKSFFSRTYELGEFVGERDYGYVSYKPLKSENTRRAPLMFIDGKTLIEPEVAEPDDTAKKVERETLEKLKKDKQRPPAPKFSRRAKLIEAGLAEGNEGYFARAFVNQTWARLFGQGLVMPVDQMHGQNKPSHPELMVCLARDFARAKFDVRALVRGLVLSDAYARDSRWPGSDRPDSRLFALATPRALTPHQLAASLLIASADPDVFANPAGVEAAVEQMERDGQNLAALFERPNFDFQVGVDEALALSNSESVATQLFAGGKGRLAAKLLALKDTSKVLPIAYANILSRAPDAREREILSAYLQNRSDRPAEGVRDVVWALLTSTEFRFNH